MKKKVYLTPSVEIEEVEIEKGFATSEAQTDGTDINDFVDDGNAW